MTLHQFLNRARTLHNIDFHELVNAGVFAHDDQRWGAFRSNPVDFMCRTDDTTAEQIWKLCEERQARYEARKS